MWKAIKEEKDTSAVCTGKEELEFLDYGRILYLKNLGDVTKTTIMNTKKIHQSG